MHSMFGIFTLREGVQIVEFFDAFNAFGEHLRNQGYASAWRFMSHEAHEGYDARPPSQPFLVEVCFESRDQAQRCWDYVEKDEEPLRSLHRNVNRRTIDTHFALYRSFGE